MSQKKSNFYTAKFKEAAVKLAVESDQPVAQTARELGVNVNTLHTGGAQRSDSRGACSGIESEQER
ncbi:transposase [Marinobacterium weihaiense]|uniref:Transposase n=1 Tax=Marinobacterium weihaiense TaxID=2851016 RepID=A0ABS6MD10_9GAMM|nr:transposase [Marinobacterium weihaiense]MBV0934186.1 transposase [Marinobacterium weihaiense]